MHKVSDLVAAQREFFNSNETKAIPFRVEQLKKVMRLLKENEKSLYQAIYEDFGKSLFETYMTELSLVYHEINYFIKNIGRWARPARVGSGLVNFPSRSYIISEPLGSTLVIGAWNYPYQLTLLPAITSIAAGNTVILKPSELPAKTSAVLADIINRNFPAEYFFVFEGGADETKEILEQKFDKIFFTGSIPVGKSIYMAAAKNLTPVTLELGGKSPTFVLADANLKIAAKRIAWAKYLNAGQSCVAPDYILAEKSIEDKFIRELISEMEKYPQHPSPGADNYLKIINARNFDRLDKLLDADKICYGGNRNREERYISPTIMRNVTFDDLVMQDEIFGPILPVITFTSLDEAIQKVKARPRPLSGYIYSNNKVLVKKILGEVSFGGGAVNESAMHLSNNKLPFGGVGYSGIGKYHGKAGFDTFSHQKSILHKSTWFEPKLKYSPYSMRKMKLIKMIYE